MPRYPGLIGPWDRSQSMCADPEVTVNWYPEPLPRHGKNQYALYPTPGRSSWQTFTEIGTRGAIDTGDRQFVVIGGQFYEIFQNQTKTARGTAMVQDSNPATLCYNSASGEILITTGGNAYIFNLTSNTLTSVLTGTATQGGLLDGFFLAFDINTGRVFASDVNDGLTWDPTQYIQSATSDPWISMVVVAQPAGIWVIGRKLGDVLYDAGTFPYPFAPIPGASFAYGTASTFSVTASGDRVSWVSQTEEGAGTVVSARGYTPQRISTHPIETAIAGFIRDVGTIADCEAMTYQDQGHQFIAFSFPTANATFVYDQTTNLWHARSTRNVSQGRDEFWHPRIHLYAYGKHLVGDRDTGVLSVLDVTYGTEANGDPIIRERIFPGLFNEKREINTRVLEIYLEAGLGLSTGQGSDPTVILRASNDGGKTYGNQRTATAGALGKYRTRVRFWKLGTSSDRVYKLTVSDPIPWRIIDGYYNNDGSARAA